MTRNEYINEYKSFDDVVAMMYESEKVVTNAYYTLIDDKRKSEQKYLFENESITALYEKDNDGFFAKIGRAIMNMIETVNKFFADIFDKIKEATGIGTTEAQKANKFISEHPEFRDKIIMAVQDGSINMGDVAKFENDSTKLIELLRQSKIDENSFDAQFAKLVENFDKYVKPTVAIGTTVVAAITLVPKLINGCSSAKKSLEKLTSGLNKLKSDIERNKKHEPSVVRACVNAYLKVIGIETKLYKDRVSFLTKITSRLRKFNLNAIANITDAMDDKMRAKNNDKIRKNRADIKEKNNLQTNAQKNSKK